ncbi:sensor domain-containing diguanylate cyclase [Metabacillus iocasae]|uniref:Diguanylate cyclase (GGDEF)-like protein n=1 Tax=Priestia iocasae TaxID=2291674 RepID=A0ABS2QWT3_9BACI|nr:sensor domain-containing diguanylate cyclase [Metabacillus iocasae]MBM7703946.1 diguanylate cyclase (GGDEF)-like protein [Metabacillus iocasae]
MKLKDSGTGYKSFEEAAADLLELVNTYMVGKMIFLGRITPETFSVLKLRDNETGCKIQEGMTVDVSNSLCQFVFNDREPMIINDIKKHVLPCDVSAIEQANVSSYMGVPIFMRNGEVFGTLCAIDSKPSVFTENDVETFKRLARFFMYVLELNELAVLDTLTGLYNRYFLYSQFEQHVKEHDEGTIMFLDLDHFKQINDMQGHEVGDLVLKEVANRIRNQIRPTDLAIRLGGDEFIVWLPGLTKKEDISQMAERILSSIKEPYAQSCVIRLAVSIGIAMYKGKEQDISSVLRQADQALYHVKNQGRNQYRFYQK